MIKILISLFLFLNFSNVIAIETVAKQAILYDYETQSIIFEKNSNELMSPSSMSKIMTIYYVFKKIKDGDISLDDEFTISKKAWKKGGSKMFLNYKSKVRVEDLIRGIIVQSGNDACIAIAEGISGSEELFVDELNALGEELGLRNSFFTNSTGWPDPEHLMTINDLLTISKRTIEDFPEYYHYYAEKEFKYNDINQLNRNPLLFSSLESDGLKTGHTSLGGYGIVATVKKNNRRLILILNGMSSSRERTKESERLMRIGFNQFQNITVVEKDSFIESVPVWAGNKKTINLVSKDKIVLTIPKKIKKSINFVVKYKSPLSPPIKKNEKAGELIVKKKSGEVLKVIDLFSDSSVEKVNFFSKILLNFKYLLLGDSMISK